MPGLNCSASAPTQPLSMALLDSLTIHAKMSLIHAITVHVSKTAPQQHKLGGLTVALPPALVETYSRLLVYPEMDTFGIKNLTGASQAHSHELSQSQAYRSPVTAHCAAYSVIIEPPGCT